ncbi:homoserine kinase [Variovorax paradoxus]|uniref:homoserine kinase n=1 Tax=Variovorax paradoxus TaxID=34073 RepID=UPI001ECF8F7C|nr:homoserine kinase [Burkholderiales bacterium]MBW8892302.1 homoserine kinase [Burkholderiales bacterium]WPH16397.1 homoserine kinase [Variovorax paradoxus]
MAVFTEVLYDEAAAFLRRLGLGNLQAMAACSGGIENTNYFVDTDHGEYVLTLFERLAWEQLPFYLHLMQHLADRGIPVPRPAPDAEGPILHRLKDKPAAVVGRLRGKNELAPDAQQCGAVGEMLARMHLAGRDYARHQPNLRGLPWWKETVPVLLPYVGNDQRTLLLDELAFQTRIAASPDYAALPRGPVHADLFRDNVMFEGGCLSGFLDFYFAGCDTFLFDIGVCLNDWCVGLDSGCADAVRRAAFLTAYESVRPLAPEERRLLPALERAAALRFWVSRLWDCYMPREAASLKAHDPSHFERVLRHRVSDATGASIF